MTALTPLAHALHYKVWPLVHYTAAQCKSLDDETRFMNDAVRLYAPRLLDTPRPLLALLWGVNQAEALRWQNGIRAALLAAERPEATNESVYAAYQFAAGEGV